MCNDQIMIPLSVPNLTAREELMGKLAEKNVQTKPVWYLNHLQKPYRNNQFYKIEKAI